MVIRQWVLLLGGGDYTVRVVKHWMDQVTLRSCGVFICGDTQSQAGYGPGQPALADLA